MRKIAYAGITGIGLFFYGIITELAGEWGVL